MVAIVDRFAVDATAGCVGCDLACDRGEQHVPGPPLNYLSEIPVAVAVAEPFILHHHMP